jgi:hypothetical protein
MASASMGSVFSVFSNDFFLLLPFVRFPGELRALALPGAPLLPLPSGAPLLPRHPGAMGGRRFPPSLLGRGMMVPTHHPSRGSSRRTGRGPEALPPSSGRPRRGGAAPAFVGAPNSSPSAPRALAPGTGKPQPPVLTARSPMRLSVWTASVEKRKTLRYITSDSYSGTYKLVLPPLLLPY